MVYKALKVSSALLGFGLVYGGILPFLVSMNSTLFTVIGLFLTVFLSISLVLYVGTQFFTNKGSKNEKVS
jgi:hypothetical protein